jgi:hypothetical protein
MTPGLRRAVHPLGTNDSRFVKPSTARNTLVDNKEPKKARRHAALHATELREFINCG